MSSSVHVALSVWHDITCFVGMNLVDVASSVARWVPFLDDSEFHGF